MSPFLPKNNGLGYYVVLWYKVKEESNNNNNDDNIQFIERGQH